MPDLPPVGPKSAIVFHDLIVHREEGRVPMLGCPQARRFVEVDDDTLAALEAIRREPVLGSAERLLQQERQESFDLVALVERLNERGFVKSIDGVALDADDQAPRRHPLLYAVSPARLRWLHHPTFFAAVGGVVAFWLATLVVDPALAPRHEDFFLSDRPLTVVVAFLGGMLAIAYLHELAHFFMARSFGIDATVSFSHRVLVLVMQTDVTNAWTLPRWKRIAIFLAGAGYNLVAASLAGLLVAASEWGFLDLSGASVALLRFFVLINLFPLAFQLLVFARTDLYFVLLALTGRRRLFSEAIRYLQFRAWRVWCMLRGMARKPCPTCRALATDEDPFCFKCGTKLPVADPNLRPFEYASRRPMLAVGLALLAAYAAVYVFFITTAMQILPAFLARSYDTAKIGWASSDYAAVGEGAFLIFVALAQAGLMIAFIVSPLLSPIRTKYRASSRSVEGFSQSWLSFLRPVAERSRGKR